MAEEQLKFVVVEDSSSGECGEPFEAEDMLEAVLITLEQMGYRIVEVEE